MIPAVPPSEGAGVSSPFVPFSVGTGVASSSVVDGAGVFSGVEVIVPPSEGAGVSSPFVPPPVGAGVAGSRVVDVDVVSEQPQDTEKFSGETGANVESPSRSPVYLRAAFIYRWSVGSIQAFFETDGLLELTVDDKALKSGLKRKYFLRAVILCLYISTYKRVDYRVMICLKRHRKAVSWSVAWPT